MFGGAEKIALRINRFAPWQVDRTVRAPDHVFDGLRRTFCRPQAALIAFDQHKNYPYDDDK